MKKSKRLNIIKILEKESVPYFREEVNSQKGITLVSLVITIIIIIILSTVTINVVLGDNGLIKQAKIAKNLTEESIASEDEKMNKLLQEYANLLAEDSEIPKPDLRSEIEKARDEETVFSTKTTLSDIHGNKVEVPRGFKIAKDTGLTVEKGVVIEDVNASTDAKVQGSQFVWIPVGKFIKDDGKPSNEIILGRYTFDEESGTPNLEQAAYTIDNVENYKNEKVIEQYYIEKSVYQEGISSSGANGKNTTAYELEKWVNSVKNNRGYYIGRYEASFASGTTRDNYKATSKVSKSKDFSSSIERSLWNNVTQQDASKVAINTYKDSSSVRSDLMNSYAWDTALVYIQEAGHDNYANIDSLNSTKENTGESGDEVCKIFDMASNLREWTTEYSSNGISGIMTTPCVYRGGYYMGDTTYTATRDYNMSDYNTAYIGFRIVLYML